MRRRHARDYSRAEADIVRQIEPGVNSLPDLLEELDRSARLVLYKIRHASQSRPQTSENRAK
jgi:hypothetical protein